MSVNLRENRIFISNLLHGDLPLVQTILSSSNAKQLSALAEILYNLRNLPLSPKVQQQLKKYTPIFKRYVNNSRQRKRLVLKHYKVIKKTLDLISYFIIELLK